MKVLSLTQPWATLVAIGAKRIETRSWQTSYRGSLAIHASKSFPKWARDVLLKLEFKYRLSGHEIPTGAIVATCQLVACVPTDGYRERNQFPDFPLTREEEMFGDYVPGRFCWLLADVRKLWKPTEARGSLGLWEYRGVL